jgi:hypothetical protein
MAFAAAPLPRPWPRASLAVMPGRGRFLDHLLVAALERAVALEQVDGVPVVVAEDLHLDMARLGDVFLNQARRVIAEAAASRCAPSSASAKSPPTRPAACPCRRRPRAP